MPSINFLDLNSFTKNLEPVTSSNIFKNVGTFHQNGLFSESIFGELGSNDRTKTFSYINLNAFVIHPTALKILLRLDKKIQKFISTEESFTLKNGELIVDPDGITGLTNFKNIISNMKFRGETPQRESLIKVITDNLDLIFIDKIPIIPPELRPAYQDEDGTWTIDTLNEVYQSLIRKSNHISSIGKNSVLFDLLSFGIQNAVIEHDNFIKTKVEKKSGIIRKQLLGKRIDFSGRAVITPDPNLKINQVGVPFRIAVTLFEPFIIHKIIEGKIISTNEVDGEIQKFIGTNLSVDTIKQIISFIQHGDKIPRRLYDIFWEICQDVMIGRAVICKRDPVLHAESVRAFTPVLSSGDTLKMCTLQVGGFNADFDGDQMAIYHPLSDQAQEEIKNKLMRVRSGDNSKKIVFELSKEMYVGLYLLTKDSKSNNSHVLITDQDLDNIINPFYNVIYRKNKTTAGRAILNSAFPNDFPFVNFQVDKKKIKNIIEALEKKYDDQVLIESASKLERIGFKWATVMAPSFSIDDIQLPPEILDLKKKLKLADTEQSIKLIKQMEEILVKHLKGTGLYDLIISGSGKGWTQPSQILIAKGVTSDPKGRVLPTITGSFADGLTTKEFFDASQGARKGLGDRVLNTATTGYMARKLAYLLNTVEIDPYLKDCKTKRVLKLKLDKNLISRLSGRYIVDKKGEVIPFDPENFKPGDIINLRSPIYCESKKLCHTCYGDLLKRYKSPYCGIYAAQIIGERSTQIIMRSFHAGGIVTIKKKDMLKDFVSNSTNLTM